MRLLGLLIQQIAWARYRRQADCARDFRVEADDVPLGLYDVCVGGVAFGSFEVVDSGGEIEGEIELDDEPDLPGERPYPAAPPDPLGKGIEVRRSVPTPNSARSRTPRCSTPAV